MKGSNNRADAIWCSCLEVATVTGGFLLVVLHTSNRSIQDAGVLAADIMISFYLQYISRFQNAKEVDYGWRTSDGGLWCCILFPAILWSNFQPYCYGGLFVKLMVPISLIYFVRHQTRNHERSLDEVLPPAVYFCGRTIFTLFSCYGSWRYNLLALTSSVQLFLMLKLVSQCFKKSFTYGEMVLVCQLDTWCWHCVLKVIFLGEYFFEGQQITVTLFVGVHVAIFAMYIVTRWKLTSVVSWVTIVMTGVVYLVFALITCGVLEMLSTLRHRLLKSGTALLLAWWSALGVSCLLLVCYHGNKTYSETKSAPDKTSKNQDMYDKISENERVNGDSDTSHTEIQQRPLLVSSSVEHSHTLVKTRNSQERVGSSYTEGCGNICDNTAQRRKPGTAQQVKGITAEQRHSQVTTVTRKYFHLVMLLVYIPGLVYVQYYELLIHASTIAAGVLVLLEACRYSGLEPVSGILNHYLSVFLDSQDTGDLILTPLYLMLGCFIPIMYPTFPYISHYSGLLSVGVGDSAASIVGSKFGRHKWPGTTKSIEGTVASMVSQLAVMAGLQYLDVYGASLSGAIVLCILLNSVLEATTRQIDNLVIPLFTCMAFRFIPI